MLQFYFWAIYLHSLQTSPLCADFQKNATPREFLGSCNQGPQLSATQVCTKCPLYSVPPQCGCKPLYESTIVFSNSSFTHCVHRGNMSLPPMWRGVLDDTNGVVGESWPLLCQSSCLSLDLLDWPKSRGDPLDMFLFCWRTGKANWCLHSEFLLLLLQHNVNALHWFYHQRSYL